MKFCFDQAVHRENIGNMKYLVSAKEVRDAGHISYAGAEMEFATAPSILAAMSRCVENGLFGFTLADTPYRDAVRQWMADQRSLTVQNDCIIPTHGTIFSLATTIRMLCGLDDAIIVQPPVYYRYEQAARRLGRRTVYNPLLQDGMDYSMDFAGLGRLMEDRRNKILVVCNPHNPIGRVWSREDLRRVAQLAAQNDVVVFSDEIFAEVVFEGRQCPSYLAIEGAKQHAIAATSLGKTFNFTGVNHANILIADADLRERFVRQRDADHYGSIDPLVYAAVLGAYSPEGAAWKDAMVEYVWANYRLIADFFSRKLPHVKISPPEGSFAIWMDFSGLGIGEEELKVFLIKQALFELDHGRQYGSQGSYYRMSIAAPRDMIKDSLDRLYAAAKLYGLAD
jgi:cystathionine beta-lyase